MPTIRRTPRHDLLREILVARRDAIGMTQLELATRMQRPQSFVSKVEHGERRLDVIEFLEIAAALGSPAEDILAELARREAPVFTRKRDGRRKRPTPS